MAAIQNQLAQGAVPNVVSNVCPGSTKFHILEVGWLECDEVFVIRGSNSSLKSTENKSFVNKRRELPMYCILIEHPHEGLILWETGLAVERITPKFGALLSVTSLPVSDTSHNMSFVLQLKPLETGLKISRKSSLDICISIMQGVLMNS